MASVSATQSTLAADRSESTGVTTEPVKCTAPEHHSSLTAVEEVLAKWEGACAICMVNQDTPKSCDYVCSLCKKMACKSCHEDMERYGNNGCSFCRNPAGFLPFGELAADDFAEMMKIPPEALRKAIEGILGEDWFNPRLSTSVQRKTVRDWFRMPLSSALEGLEFCNKNDATLFAAWNMVKGAIGSSLGLVRADVERTRNYAADLRKRKAQLSSVNEELRKTVEELKKTVEEQATKAAEFDACEESRKTFEKKLAAVKGHNTKIAKKAEADKAEIGKLHGLVKHLSGMLPQTTCNFCGKNYPKGTKHSAACNDTDVLASECYVPYTLSSCIMTKLGMQAAQAAASWYTHIVVCLVANIDGESELVPYNEYFLRCDEARCTTDDRGRKNNVITKRGLNKPFGLSTLFKWLLSTEFAGSGCADFKILRSIHRQYCVKFFENAKVEFTDVFEIHNDSMRKFCEWVLPVAFSGRSVTSNLTSWKPFTQDLFSPDELRRLIPEHVLCEFIEGRILNSPAPTFIGTAPFGGMDYLWDPTVRVLHFVPPEVRQGLLRSAGDNTPLGPDENSFYRYNAAKQNYCDFTAKLAAFASAYAELRKSNVIGPSVFPCAYEGCMELVDIGSHKVGESVPPFVRLKDGVCHYECYSKHCEPPQPCGIDDHDITQELRKFYKHCADPDNVLTRKRRRCDVESLCASVADVSTDSNTAADDLDLAASDDTQPYVHSPILVESDGEQE